MDSKKVIGIVAAVAALLGLFMPIAAAGQVWVGIQHIGGISFALYLLAPALLILSILRQYKSFAGDRGWIIGVGVITTILLGITRYAASAHLIAFADMAGLFGEDSTNVVSDISSGMGFFLILAGAILCVTMAAIDKPEPVGASPKDETEDHHTSSRTTVV